MSHNRVELRPHVLHPDLITVSVYHDNVLVFTQIEPRYEAIKLAESLSREGHAVDWNCQSGSPYRQWRQTKALSSAS